MNLQPLQVTRSFVSVHIGGGGYFSFYVGMSAELQHAGSNSAHLTPERT